jgi:transcriptional regulator with XRE-family HTH domain
MTQERLALRAKLTPALISDSERGLRNLSFQSLERWLSALEVDWARFGAALAREAAQSNEHAEDPDPSA